MSHPRYPRQLPDDRDSGYPYLEDMDVYEEGLEAESKWFPWVTALGLFVACAGIGIAFTWLMSPVSPSADRQRVEPASDIANAQFDEANLSDSEDDRNRRPLISSRNSDREREDSDSEQQDISASIDESEQEDNNPLGVPLTDLPLIPVDPTATSRVRPSRITDDFDSSSAVADSRPSRDSELLARDGEIAVNPDLRESNESSNESESSREYPRQYFLNEDETNSPESSRQTATDRLTVLERPLNNSQSSQRVPEEGRELVENTNVAVAATTSPRLDLGTELGEGSFLVLMAYQGDGSLSQARKYSQGAFIKQLDGETYVQLAAFDQLEYARHMADNLRSQGVAVLILQ